MLSSNKKVRTHKSLNMEFKGNLATFVIDFFFCFFISDGQNSFIVVAAKREIRNVSRFIQYFPLLLQVAMDFNPVTLLSSAKD